MQMVLRQVGEKVNLKDLDISIEILQIFGETVNLGFSSPDFLSLEDEFENDDLSADMLHEFKNRLTSICISLHLYRSQMEKGQQSEAEARFENILSQIEKLASLQSWSEEKPKSYQASVLDIS